MAGRAHGVTCTVYSTPPTVGNNAVAAAAVLQSAAFPRIDRQRRPTTSLVSGGLTASPHSGSPTTWPPPSHNLKRPTHRSVTYTQRSPNRFPSIIRFPTSGRPTASNYLCNLSSGRPTASNQRLSTSGRPTAFPHGAATPNFEARVELTLQGCTCAVVQGQGLKPLAFAGGAPCLSGKLLAPGCALLVAF
jgi:hypothetical protein